MYLELEVLQLNDHALLTQLLASYIIYILYLPYLYIVWGVASTFPFKVLLFNVCFTVPYTLVHDLHNYDGHLGLIYVRLRFWDLIIDLLFTFFIFWTNKTSFFYDNFFTKDFLWPPGPLPTVGTKLFYSLD